jgi:predicted amino acid dehydrogenase
MMANLTSATSHADQPLIDVSQLTVAVLGGTGPQGRGLAVRLAAVGQSVLLGSRDADRAAETAKTVAERAASSRPLVRQ